MKFPSFGRKSGGLKTCKKCGKESDFLVDSYCNDCNPEVVENSTEESSEWNREIAHNQYLGVLNNPIANDPIEYQRTLDMVLTLFEPADWLCTKCNKLRLSQSSQKSKTPSDAISFLMSSCPECNVSGYLTQQKCES